MLFKRAHAGSEMASYQATSCIRHSKVFLRSTVQRRCPLSQRDADRAIRADIQFHAQQVSLVKRFLLLVRHHNPRVLQRRLHHLANVEWFRAFSRQLLIDLLLNCIDQRTGFDVVRRRRTEVVNEAERDFMPRQGVHDGHARFPFSSITRKRTLSSWRIIAQ